MCIDAGIDQGTSPLTADTPDLPRSPAAWEDGAGKAKGELWAYSRAVLAEGRGG